MDEVELDLPLERMAASAGLASGDLDPDCDFSLEWGFGPARIGGVAEIEREDVGRPRLVEEVAVEPLHRRVGQERDRDAVWYPGKDFRGRAPCGAQSRRVDPPESALRVDL